METIQVTVSEGLKIFLQTQAQKHGFPSPNEYLQSLLAEREQRVKEKKDLEASLLEAARSPTVVADKAFWVEKVGFPGP